MTTEKVLPARKRRKKQPAPKRLFARPQGQAKVYPKGRVIRVSSTVFSFLGYKRKKKEQESWDTLLRRLLNIPLRKGEAPHLFETWILPSTGETFPTKALARGQSIKNGVLAGKAGKFEEPLLMREVV